MSFKVKTLLFFLAAGLVPYLLVVGFVTRTSEDRLAQSLENEMRSALEQSAARIDNHLEVIRSDLHFLAKLDVMDDVLTKDIDRRISNLLETKKKDLKLRGDFYVTDLTGEVVAASDPALLRTIPGKKAAFSLPLAASFDQRPLGALHLDYSPENLAPFRTGGDRYAFYIREKAGGKTYFKQETFPYDMAVTRELPLLPGYEMVLGADKARAYEVLDQITRVMFLSVAGGALLITLASIYFAARIIRPIRELSATALEIGDTKDYSKRVAVAGEDEIGKLSKAFNLMVASVEEALEKLRVESENRVHLAQERQKNEMLQSLSSQLSKYLSPQVFHSIFSGKQEVKLESRRKKLTVFFSDIVGFTETTDTMEAEDLSALLNHYLDEMSRIALAHGATLDKFIGDAIMAFFGDPESRGDKEDAMACVAMALEMREKLALLREEWRARGMTRPFRIRCGIHTGYCTVGNFGSEDRMDYTIIGGSVNLASRLESAADPDEVVVSEETWLLVRDRYACEEKGSVTAKGIAHPVKTYRVVGPLEEKAKPVEARFSGLSLRFQPGKMDETEKEAARNTLNRLIDQLKE